MEKGEYAKLFEKNYAKCTKFEKRFILFCKKCSQLQNNVLYLCNIILTTGVIT